MTIVRSAGRCTARRRDGTPCRNHARLGTNVCRMHGGSAPQVLRAAQVRLLMSADEVMGELLKIIRDKELPATVRLVAIRDALDRAGLTAAKHSTVDVMVEVKPWEERMNEAIGEVVVDYGDED